MITVNASVKFQYLLTACHLVKIIDILCDYCFEFAGLFKLGKLQMSRIWFRCITEHLITVEFIKFVRMT